MKKLILLIVVTSGLFVVWNKAAQATSVQSNQENTSIIKSKSVAKRMNTNTKAKEQQFSLDDITGNVKTHTGKLHAAPFYVMPWENSGWHHKVQILHHNDEITYNLSRNNQNYDVIRKAIAAWNSLGVIKLVPVNSHAEINITNTNHSYGDTVTGNTDVHANWADNSTYAIISSADIVFTPYFETLTTAQQTNIAEHELGHALGFAHENRRLNYQGHSYRFIMSAWGTSPRYTIPLGQLERQTLAYYYANQLNANAKG